MKNLLFLLVIFFLEQYNCDGQNIFFPDSNFKNKLLSASAFNQVAYNTSNQQFKIDNNNDNEISFFEAQQVGYLNLFYSNISNLSGIQYFINLKDLSVHYNPLNDIDTTAILQLVALRCDLTNLTSLNLSGMVNLNYLTCPNNNISNIDFTGLPNLKAVSCSNNQITTLDFSNNPQFKELVCNNNNLTSINIKNGSFQNINLSFPNSNNDCWKNGNPNLTNICADENEVAPLTAFLTSCNSGANPTIDSSCVLSNEQFVKNEFLVYPNPTNSIINVKFNSNFNSNVNFNNNIELLDIQGRVLQSQKVSNAQTSLDISGLDIGVYFLKINSGNREQIQKIIKK